MTQEERISIEADSDKWQKGDHVYSHFHGRVGTFIGLSPHKCSVFLMFPENPRPKSVDVRDVSWIAPGRDVPDSGPDLGAYQLDFFPGLADNDCQLDFTPLSNADTDLYR